jgi:hypothetical protein
MAAFTNTLKDFLKGLLSRSSNKNDAPTYQGLTPPDIKNWREWVNTGELKELDPEEAKIMLHALASMESGIERFLLEHEKILEKLDYTDEFLLAIERFIEKTTLKIRALESKPVAQLTEEDLTFLENMSILLGQTSKLSGIAMKKDAPQKQLLNRLGVWEQQIKKIQNSYEQFLGPRPGFHPQPRL